MSDAAGDRGFEQQPLGTGVPQGNHAADGFPTRGMEAPDYTVDESDTDPTVDLFVRPTRRPASGPEQTKPADADDTPSDWPQEEFVQPTDERKAASPVAGAAAVADEVDRATYQVLVVNKTGEERVIDVYEARSTGDTDDAPAGPIQTDASPTPDPEAPDTAEKTEGTWIKATEFVDAIAAAKAKIAPDTTVNADAANGVGPATDAPAEQEHTDTPDTASADQGVATVAEAQQPPEVRDPVDKTDDEKPEGGLWASLKRRIAEGDVEQEPQDRDAAQTPATEPPTAPPQAEEAPAETVQAPAPAPDPPRPPQRPQPAQPADRPRTESGAPEEYDQPTGAPEPTADPAPPPPATPPQPERPRGIQPERKTNEDGMAARYATALVTDTEVIVGRVTKVLEHHGFDSEHPLRTKIGAANGLSTENMTGIRERVLRDYAVLMEKGDAGDEDARAAVNGLWTTVGDGLVEHLLRKHADPRLPGGGEPLTPEAAGFVHRILERGTESQRNNPYMKRLGNVLTDAALRHVDIPVNVSVTVGNPNAQNQQQEVVRTADTIQDKAVLKYLQAVYVHDRTSFRVTEGELSADQQRLVDHRSAARQATIAGYVKDISARGSHGLPPKLVQHFNETRAAEKRAARVAAAKRAGAAVTSTVAQAARAVIPPKVEYPKDEQGREYEFRRVRGADGQVREERVYRSKGESWLSKVFTRANR